MNKLTVIGNLTKDPELRTTQTGKEVCSFTVAVNRRKKIQGQPEADFFRVTTWEERARVCHKYLAKGKKVCAVGPVSVRTYTASDGSTRADMEVAADEVEFLSPSDTDRQSGMQKVEPADNPFTQTTMDELPPY